MKALEKQLTMKNKTRKIRHVSKSLYSTPKETEIKAPDRIVQFKHAQNVALRTSTSFTKPTTPSTISPNMMSQNYIGDYILYERNIRNEKMKYSKEFSILQSSDGVNPNNRRKKTLTHSSILEHPGNKEKAQTALGFIRAKLKNKTNIQSHKRGISLHNNSSIKINQDSKPSTAKSSILNFQRREKQGPNANVSLTAS